MYYKSYYTCYLYDSWSIPVPIDSTGKGTFAIPSIYPRTYTVWVKAANALAERRSMTLSSGVYDMGSVATRWGDVNGDNVINTVDADYLMKAFTQYNSAADFNKSGNVDCCDAAILAKYYGQSGSTATCQ